MSSVIGLLKDELNMIQDANLRKKVITFLECKVPDYFWTVPASSSGKYHPSITVGEHGLVKHTKMVVEVANELMRLEEFDFSEDIQDSVIAACILHDTFKHGYTDCGYTVTTHDLIAADEWVKYILSLDNIRPSYVDCVYAGIVKHMGQWGSKSARLLDFSNDEEIVRVCKLVHMADYTASRKFFDKFKEMADAKVISRE